MVMRKTLQSCQFFLVGALVLCLGKALIFKNRGAKSQISSSTNNNCPPGLYNDSAIHCHFMELALEQAREAGRRGEVPIGAIVVRPDVKGNHIILSSAHNLVETDFDATSHAELLAMRQAARKQKNWRLLNCTLYTTLEPCPMCLSAAQAFRISTIVYGAPDLRVGAIESYLRLLDINHPTHNIDGVVSGVLRNESATLMRNFFRERRQMGKATPMQHSASLLRNRIRKILQSGGMK